ncbi:MAG: DNA replication and repair protein RecF, partial [Pseudomonadota bacterium]
MKGLAVSLARLALRQLVIAQLRNLEQVCFEPVPRLNVISGANGQGKTSILEAIYLLLTSKSFRTPRSKELIRLGQTIASVRAVVVEHWQNEAITREQSVGLQASTKLVRLDGEPPISLAHYATRSPVVLFDPHQLVLSTGPAAPRRTLLDRLTLFTHPQLAPHRSHYVRALKGRQRLLADRYPRIEQCSELDAYETLLAEHGAAITRARTEAALRLADRVREAFGHIATDGLSLEVAYAAAGSDNPAHACQELYGARSRDARCKRAAFGPHRDDLVLSLAGQPARVVASQGQHRMITLALKVAEMGCIC